MKQRRFINQAVFLLLASVAAVSAPPANAQIQTTGTPGSPTATTTIDGRTYEHVVALRAVQTSDFMTAHFAPLPQELLAKVANRIINEVRGINRVVYDVSSKPPATIEWE